MSAQIIELSPSRRFAASNLNKNQSDGRLLAGNLALAVSENLEKFGGEDTHHMKCEICEELDNHLQDFVSGESDELTTQRLSQHLSLCPSFRKTMEEYQFLQMASSLLTNAAKVDTGVSSRLRSKLNSELGLKLKG